MQYIFSVGWDTQYTFFVLRGVFTVKTKEIDERKLKKNIYCIVQSILYSGRGYNLSQPVNWYILGLSTLASVSDPDQSTKSSKS